MSVTSSAAILRAATFAALKHRAQKRKVKLIKQIK